MACPICYEEYDEYTTEKNCYIICENERCGYSVCKKCMDRVDKCPSCRGRKKEHPIFVRINNSEQRVPDRMEIDSNDRVVLLMDRSSSMEDVSGETPGAPLRIELSTHMTKIILAFCKKLRVKCSIHAFSTGLIDMNTNENTPEDQSNRTLEAIRPSGCTNLGFALKQLFELYGESAKYFVFTDGDPSDQYIDSIKKFVDAQLHLIAFSKDIEVKLLNAVRGNPKHSISYVEDIRSLSGYMIPTFIWAMTNMKTVELSPIDEECRKKYIEILEPQISGDYSRYRKEDLVTLLYRYKSNYSRDLEIDTTGLPKHGRIAYSFDKNNWNTFGRFYLPCISDSHQFKRPGNLFDISLKNYRTKEYEEIYEKIADIPEKIKFVSFMTSGAQREIVSAAASAVVQQSFQTADTYYSSSDNDGCIGPDALVDGVPMKDVLPGNRLNSGDLIKYIIRVRNLNRGNPITLYNGMTGSHPVQDRDGNWIKAKYYPHAEVTYTTNVVYDVILEDPMASSMRVNDIAVAVAGYPVPEMIHPYWGTSKILDDVKKRYPDGGFVDVDGKDFQFTNGVVSSLFSAD